MRSLDFTGKKPEMQVTISSMECPCKSHLSYAECCLPFHKGLAIPQTPTALMRSRFSAYALSLANYIIDTTDPSGPQYSPHTKQWLISIEHFSRTTAFQDLTILKSQMLNNSEGTVTFHARLLSLTGEDLSFTEISLFKKKKGHWYYHSPIKS
jgi:SEC-C motif-containing protein